MERCGLNTSTDEVPQPDPPIAPNEPATVMTVDDVGTDKAPSANPQTTLPDSVLEIHLEKESSAERHITPDDTSDVLPDSHTSLSLRIHGTVVPLPRKGFFSVHEIFFPEEREDQTLIAEQTLGLREYECEQQDVLVEHARPPADCLLTTADDCSLVPLTAAPQISSSNRFSSPIGCQHVHGGECEGRSSQISPTPPLTPAETTSTDDASAINVKPSEMTPNYPARQHLSSDTNSHLASCGSESKPGSTRTIVVVQVPFINMISCPLLSLWPAYESPWTLSASEICDIHGVAASLAAAGLFDDAFDLFYVEYRYWQARMDDVPYEEMRPRLSDSIHSSARSMITAAINCARSFVPGRRIVVAGHILSHVKSVLQKFSYTCSLDMALVDLYLSNVQKISESPESRCTKAAPLASALSYIGAGFRVILPEIQDREHIFIANCLKRTLGTRVANHFQPTPHSLEGLLERASEEHLLVCKEVRTAMRTLLECCKTFARRKRGALNKTGAGLPIEFQTRECAVWLFYINCICGISHFDSLVQCADSVCLGPLCRHGSKLLRIDTLLALAVISESLLKSGTEKSWYQHPATRTGDYVQAEIKALLSNWHKRGPSLIGTYLSRTIEIPMWPTSLEVSNKTGSVMVTETIKTIFTLRNSSRRSSTTGSFRSSINSIRSSMSWDTKQNFELRDRLRRPMSMLSIRSKKSHTSNTMSIASYGSDGFERVTGMPSSDPSDEVEISCWSDLANEHVAVIGGIAEDVEDVEMHDYPVAT